MLELLKYSLLNPISCAQNLEYIKINELILKFVQLISLMNKSNLRIRLDLEEDDQEVDYSDEIDQLNNSQNSCLKNLIFSMEYLCARKEVICID